ncbi:MAG: HD domain-containing protein [Bdellovibrionota bacterium]
MTALCSRSELLAWVQQNPKLQPLLEHISSQPSDDSAHDQAHLLRVAYWTIKLAGDSVPTEESVAAALLHDLVNVPKNHPDRAKASEFSAEAALPLLSKAGFSSEAMKNIADAIRDHSFSRGAVPTSALGKALQDADRLEAVGAIGLMRVFSTGARMGTKYFDPQDPWAKNRELNDKAFSVDHFFAKLLLLAPTFHTEQGKQEAARRTGVLEQFLTDLGAEIGEPKP